MEKGGRGEAHSGIIPQNKGRCEICPAIAILPRRLRPWRPDGPDERW